MCEWRGGECPDLSIRIESEEGGEGRSHARGGPGACIRI